MSNDIPSVAGNLPLIYGDPEKVKNKPGVTRKVYSSLSKIKTDKVNAAFGIALHMHQPTIPAGEDNLESAALISNLQYMMEHQDIGDNHNAPVFLNCYYRMSDFIKELAGEGRNPRVMLDYSGNLLWGLEQMGEDEAIDKLKMIACDNKYYPYVEWLGTMWSHAVVSSTPVPDIKLHVESWRHHFASFFGYEALKRVKGFSPPEMHLPIHPDICYEYVRALKEYGYSWLMVQEHTIEKTDASPLDNPYFPHKLVARNSLGQEQEIVVLIKTQGSDTKLVAQMQPYYEAKSKGRQNYAGANLFPYVLQIGDGENGGVMMNEFPQGYKKAFKEIGTEGVVSMNGSEYLEFIYELGVKDDDLIEVQPVSQSKIWECMDGFRPGAAEEAIEKAKEKYPGFSLEKASWTNDKNWVKGYKDVMDPLNSLSAAFHNLFDGREKSSNGSRYREALLYLLLSQTSCFRYWGKGLWTDYAKEICRRGMKVLGE